jgi:hypothetical protein
MGTFQKRWFWTVPAILIAAAFLTIPYATRSSNSKFPWIAKQGCYQAPDSEWHYAGSVEYSGYTAIKEVCDNLEPWARVVIDSDSHVRLFTFNDDGIEHVNVVRFKSEKRPLLFVMTMSAGTGAYADLHFLSDADGTLKEWTWPDLDPSLERLLQGGEHTCCKDWNYHLLEDELVLARGIYKKNDGNCCPSRGGIVARLRPTSGRFEIIEVKRVTLEEYASWRFKPFCVRCTLD